MDIYVYIYINNNEPLNLGFSSPQFFPGDFRCPPNSHRCDAQPGTFKAAEADKALDDGLERAPLEPVGSLNACFFGSSPCPEKIKDNQQIPIGNPKNRHQKSTTNVVGKYTIQRILWE